MTSQPDPNEINRQIIAEFRANAGSVGGMLEGVDMLLLHTVGAKSGAPRVNPLRYRQLTDDGGAPWAVFGSGGGTSHPAWVHNLLANSDTTVELGAETIEVRARIAAGEERERIWSAQKAGEPMFAEFERAAGHRTIPVVILEQR